MPVFQSITVSVNFRIGIVHLKLIDSSIANYWARNSASYWCRCHLLRQDLSVIMYKGEKPERIVAPSPANSGAIDQVRTIAIGKAVKFVDVILIQRIDRFVDTGTVKYHFKLQAGRIRSTIIILKTKLLVGRYYICCKSVYAMVTCITILFCTFHRKYKKYKKTS